MDSLKILIEIVEDIETKHTCKRCRKEWVLSKTDVKKNGQIFKTCLDCRKKDKEINQCPHDKRKQDCKKCTNPVKITIRKWINHCRTNDKKYQRYDADRFIDKCFLKGLVEDSENKCYYCKKELQYDERKKNLASIERIDDNLGHIKSNCVIACFSCNCRRIKEIST